MWQPKRKYPENISKWQIILYYYVINTNNLIFYAPLIMYDHVIM